MKKKCPHCGAIIEYLKYNANYSEVIYGDVWGEYDLETENHESDGSETNNYDNYEEYHHEYQCPKCEEYLDIEDLLEYNEEKKKEIKKVGNLKIGDKIILPNFPSFNQIYTIERFKDEEVLTTTSKFSFQIKNCKKYIKKNIKFDKINL